MHTSGTFLSNYREILGSCFTRQLASGIYISKMKPYVVCATTKQHTHLRLHDLSPLDANITPYSPAFCKREHDKSDAPEATRQIRQRKMRTRREMSSAALGAGDSTMPPKGICATMTQFSGKSKSRRTAESITGL